MTSRRLMGPRALSPLLIAGLVCLGVSNPVSAATDNSRAIVGEVPTAVAVSDTGIIAASLYDARAIALVDPEGTVRQASLDCSPSDVEIAPDGATAWAVCQESEHLNVIDVASLEVGVASMTVGGLDAIAYLPAVDELIIGSLEGWVIAVGDVSTGGYVPRRWSQFPQDGPYRITQLAPLSDGTGAYAITDAGDLVFADLQFTGEPRIIARMSSERSFQSIALSPFGTVLYAAVVDFDSAQTVTTVETIDMATGAARQRVNLQVTGDFFSTLDLAAGYRAVYVTSGVGAQTPSGNDGLLTLPVDDRGRMGDVQAAPATAAGGSGTAVSANYARVAFGTTDGRALDVVVDDAPYPSAVYITAKAKGSNFTVSGTTTSLPVLTELTVYVKDLTKKKATFVKQSKQALVNFQGVITWRGKAPSKKFAVYLAGASAKSKTVTVKRR